MQIAIILFILTYVFMFIFFNHKHLVALISAITFVLLNILPLNKVLSSIDYNIILMILGIMGTVNLFIKSNMPSRISDYIIKYAKDVKWMTVFLAIFAGLVSAFVDNVATVLMIAPVALVVSKKLHISPVPILISISMFSNLEGAATLVGDTTSILLAGAAKMDFLDFFFYKGKIGLFFIIQVGLILSSLVLLYKLRHQNKLINNKGITKVEDFVPTFLLVGTIISLIFASFIPNKPSITNGIICVIFYIVGLIRNIIKTKKLDSFKENVKSIDYETLLLLASLFVVIAGIKEAGVIVKLSEIIIDISNNNIFILYTVIVLASSLLSAFIDNIPYVATMLPVIASISIKLGIDPTILYYGLIIGATLGGNLTPVGASANIASIGLLNKNGYKVSLKEYLSYSLPITIVAILSGYIIVGLLFL